MELEVLRRLQAWAVLRAILVLRLRMGCSSLVWLAYRGADGQATARELAAVLVAYVIRWRKVAEVSRMGYPTRQNR